MKTITAIEQIRIRNQVIKSQVMQACNVSEEEFGLFLFECGIAWIKERCHKDDSVVSMISSEPFFWKWYQNQWFKLENEFLASNVIYIMMPRPDVDKMLKAEWKRIHENHGLFSYPNGPEWDSIMKRLFKS